MTLKEEMQAKIEALEAAMSSADFWSDKDAAQATIDGFVGGQAGHLVREAVRPEVLGAELSKLDAVR